MMYEEKKIIKGTSKREKFVVNYRPAQQLVRKNENTGKEIRTKAMRKRTLLICLERTDISDRLVLQVEWEAVISDIFME